MIESHAEPQRSILVPTAHDEPAIRLGIYREMFGLPAAIAYNTETERRFLKGELGTAAPAEETVGCGVDLPATSLLPVPERPSSGGRSRVAPCEASAQLAAAIFNMVVSLSLRCVFMTFFVMVFLGYSCKPCSCEAMDWL